MMMSNFTGLTVPEGQKEEIRMDNTEIVKFKYPEVVADNYRYRGALENHNALIHDGGENINLVWRVNGELPGGPFEFFFHSMH